MFWVFLRFLGCRPPLGLLVVFLSIFDSESSLLLAIIDFTGEYFLDFSRLGPLKRGHALAPLRLGLDRAKVTGGII